MGSQLLAAELPEHQRGRDRDRALPDRGGQTEDLVPVSPDGLGVDLAPNECRVITGLSGDEQPLVGQIANAWREAKPEQVHQREDVVGDGLKPYSGFPFFCCPHSSLAWESNWRTIYQEAEL